MTESAAQASVKKTFDALASEWETETEFFSFVEPMILHPSYQGIIRLGWPAVPLILDRLSREPDHWFVALQKITGEDPAPAEVRGSFCKVREAWLHWGAERGYRVARPVVLILHGPSGVGKDSIIASLGMRRLISTTDRAPRSHARGHKDNEVDGLDYHFVTPDRFTELIASGLFAEHAGVYGHRKGLEWRELKAPLTAGEDFIIRTDVQGAESWRTRLEGAVTLLVLGVDPALPLASHELDLGMRLRERKEADEEIRKRLAALPFDLQRIDANDYVVVNTRGALDQTAENVRAIIERERYNPSRPAPRLRD